MVKNRRADKIAFPAGRSVATAVTGKKRSFFFADFNIF
jgi:hypothetical protein